MQSRTTPGHGAGEHLPAGAAFHERLAAGWDDAYAGGGFRRRLALVDELLRGRVTPGSRWLDAGCGTGTVTRRLAALGAIGDAIDGSPAMLAAAQRLARRGPAPTAFRYRRVATVERLDGPDAAYDGVISSSVIEYLEKPLDALHELARVLKPGGTLLVSLANRHSVVRRLQQVLRTAGARLGKDPFPYLGASRAAFSRHDAARIIRDCGILVDTVREFDPLLPTLALRFIPGALIFIVGTKRMDGDRTTQHYAAPPTTSTDGTTR